MEHKKHDTFILEEKQKNAILLVFVLILVGAALKGLIVGFMLGRRCC